MPQGSLSSAQLPTNLSPHGGKSEHMVVGDPMATDVHMGALISAAHLSKVLDYVQLALPKARKLPPVAYKSTHKALKMEFYGAHHYDKLS